MGVVLRTDRLTKRFDRLTAVEDLDLEVREGEVFGFIGPNGAGKTTTLRLLCALISPTSGRAEVAGFRLGSEDERIRASVGILTEQPGLYERQSAEENLLFFAALFGLAPAIARDQTERYLRLMSSSSTSPRPGSIPTRRGRFASSSRRSAARAAPSSSARTIWTRPTGSATASRSSAAR